MNHYTRRQFLGASALGLSAAGLALSASRTALAQQPGDRPQRDPGVVVLNPRNRVPVSLIIDDSTCLVNLSYFAIPQFAQVYPDRYKQPWRMLPREIPDSFVRKFGEWCHERGIKGKYSIVPYPACVGWLDRELPGWSRQELAASVDLVRTLMVPDWDIHPEMVTHTWVIDTKTGRPYEEKSERYLENSGWSVGRSVDELAEYMRYALRPLKNLGLPCEGITTPGGFGNRVLPELAQATFEACRDVYSTEIPHYFRHLFTDDRSVAPQVQYARDLDSADPKCVVSIIGCTGDWFGGWDGLNPGHVDQFITEDGHGGRLPQVIARGEPAILVCHWPGIYYNGDEIGFEIFQEVVRRLDATYDHLLWMKNSEIARYWAAKELTSIATRGATIEFRAPFAADEFTIELVAPMGRVSPRLAIGATSTALREAPRPIDLTSGAWTRRGDKLVVCFDLPRGRSSLELTAPT